MKWDEESTWSSQLEVEEVKCTFPELSPLPLLWGCCWYVRSEQQRWRVVGLVWTHHVLCWLCILVFGGVCQCGLLSLPLPGRISLRMIAERRENGEFGRKKPACDSQLRLWTWHLLLMFANVKTFVLSGFTAAALEHPDTSSQALTGPILRSETQTSEQEDETRTRRSVDTSCFCLEFKDRLALIRFPVLITETLSSLSQLSSCLQMFPDVSVITDVFMKPLVLSGWTLSPEANWTFRPHQLKLTLTYFTFMCFNLQPDPRWRHIFNVAGPWNDYSQVKHEEVPS